MSQNYGNTNTHFTKTEMNPTSVTLKRKRDDSSSDDNEKEVKRAPSRESCMSRETPSPSSSSQGGQYYYLVTETLTFNSNYVLRSNRLYYLPLL